MSGKEANRNLIRKLARYQDGLCFLCGERVDTPEPGDCGPDENDKARASLKHIVAPSLNGNNGSANLVVAHRGCNSSRGAEGLTESELIRLQQLNEKRNDEIALKPGIVDDGSFRYCNGVAFQVLMDMLGKEENGRESRRRLKSVLSILTRTDRRLIDLQDIRSNKSFEYMVALVRQNTFAILDRNKAFPDLVDQYLRNILTAAFRKVVENRFLTDRNI